MYIGTFEQNGKYGFKDGWKIVLPAIYDGASSFSDGVAIVVLNNKFGIINESGALVVENKYDDLYHLFDKFYVARVNCGDDWNCGIIDIEDNVIVEFAFKCIYSKDQKYFQCFKEAQSKHEGLKYFSFHGRYTYSNQKNCHWYSINGLFITSLDVSEIHDNYLIVKDEYNKFGLFRDDANVVVNPKYDKLIYGIDGITVATINDNGIVSYSIIDSNDNKILTSEKEITYNNGFFVIKREEVEDWYSFEGNLIHTGHAIPLSKSFIAIYKNKKYGVFDYKGNRIINFLYDEIKFEETYFIVRRDNKIGLLGLKGEVIVDAIYNKIESVIIKNNPINLGSEKIPNRVWGYYSYSGYCEEYWYDTNGHQDYRGEKCDRIRRQFVSVRSNSRYNFEYSITDTKIDITKPLILSSEGNKELVTNSEGLIPNSKFEDIEQITPICYVVKSGEKYGVFRIDTQSLIIPIQYDRIQFFGGHTVLLCKDGLWGAKTLILESNLFHLLFNVDIPVEYSELKILDSIQSLFGVKKNKKTYGGEEIEIYTIINDKGKEVDGLCELCLEEQFTYFDKHHILTKHNGKFGFISSLGFITLPFIYDEISVRKTGGYNVRIGEAWGVLDNNCKEVVRVKYTNRLPIYVTPPEDSFFDYDEIKDDIARETKRYKNLILVTDASSNCMGCLNINGNEVIPTIFEHLMFNISDQYSEPNGFEKDVLFFGYGGYKNDGEYGSNFFSDIDGANWGCINTNGKIIIDPNYDCFKVIGPFLLAGRDGSFLGEERNDRDYYDKYSGVYDLYNRDGQMIIGGFREIYFDEQTGSFAIFFGGEWKRYSTYEDDWNNIYCYDYSLKHKNDLWLLLDKNMKTIIRKNDGSQHQFSKGFVGEIKIKTEENKVTHLYNMPIDLMAKGFSHFGDGCAFIKENNSNEAKKAALNIKTGEITPYYEKIEQIEKYHLFFSLDRKVGLRTFSDIVIPPEYLLFTLPVKGFFFAVKEIDDDHSRVELFNLSDVSLPICIAINKIETCNLIDDIGHSRLKISFNIGSDLHNLQVPSHELFDDDFVKLIDKEESRLFSGSLWDWPSQWEDHYYYTSDYRIGKDDYYESDYEDEHDYMRDTWDAMTDGMYGDMPDGFDGDFDFLGR